MLTQPFRCAAVERPASGASEGEDAQRAYRGMDGEPRHRVRRDELVCHLQKIPKKKGTISQKKCAKMITTSRAFLSAMRQKRFLRLLSFLRFV